MSIRTSDLKNYVIDPVLRHLNLWSQSAVNLMLLTAAQESAIGTYLHQIDGPGLGIYSIEPATHKDVWRYLNTQRPDLGELVNHYNTFGYFDDSLVWNLSYATAIARVKYYMVQEPIPGTLQEQAEYYKKYYNTKLGKATVAEAITNYIRYVLDEA